MLGKDTNRQREPIDHGGHLTGQQARRLLMSLGANLFARPTDSGGFEVVIDGRARGRGRLGFESPCCFSCATECALSIWLSNQDLPRA